MKLIDVRPRATTPQLDLEVVKLIDVETIGKLQTARKTTTLKPGYWVSEEEANFLYIWASEFRPGCIFESGTAFGYSAMWLSLVGCPVFTFDPHPQKKYVWEELGYDQPENLTLVHDRFSSIVTMNRDVPGKRFFFIDGKHSMNGVEEDCEALRQYAKDGDMVVFHDLKYKGPLRGFKGLKSNASLHEVYHTRNMIGRLIWQS